MVKEISVSMQPSWSLAVLFLGRLLIIK
uniref:XK related 9 n=1 Tax=Molossus molossus TaxID=27622 RepID=A0A7J8DUX2_MOLMO|nr:XK related 9 [Molossus molossus]